MKLAAAVACLFVLAPALQTPRPDLHLVLETSRTRLDFVQNETVEHWIGSDRQYTRQGNTARIVRRDLGVNWMIDIPRRGYVESPIRPQPPRASEPPAVAAPKPAPDIRKAGFLTDAAEFDWAVGEVKETRLVGGCRCRGFVADGDAEFDEILVSFWVCPDPRIADPRRVSDLLLASIRQEDERRAITDVLGRFDGGALMAVEERRKPGIGVPLVTKSTVIAVEERVPPDGIYDLPPEVLAGAGRPAPVQPGPPPPQARSAPAAYRLPPPVLLELHHLEETYHVLDAVAGRIWPGWKNYRRFPFLLRFPNGLRVLVNHPTPPSVFELVGSVTVDGAKVFVDRSRVTSLPLALPLRGEGGLLPYGTTPQGWPQTTVQMTFRPMSEKARAAGRIGERQILVYLHELFHCFQEDNVTRKPLGNLRLNPDVPFATYTTVEGLALDRAYHEQDALRARQYVVDFLAARALKRKSSMTPQEGEQESTGDLTEGTAEYAELRALEALGEGFVPKLSPSDDPGYSGFKEATALAGGYVDELRARIDDLLVEAHERSYQYGCFQALLLQRFFPDWQEPFVFEPALLDRELARRFNVSDNELAAAEGRFEETYNLGSIRARAARIVAERDAAYGTAVSRTGRSYIINFGEALFVTLVPREGSRAFPVGYTLVFPAGVARTRTAEIDLSAIHAPLQSDSFFRHLKVVDTAPAPVSRPYQLTCRARDGDVCLDAVARTPLFTLAAPRLRVKERGARVKFEVLPER